MKALTLTQPWATLVAIGAKRIETRSWGTSYRGPLAIHAAKGFPKWAQETCLEDQFWKALNGKRPMVLAYKPKLPCGVVLATCRLIDCRSTVYKVPNGVAVFEKYPKLETDQELEFGDYAPGRWAWVLEDVKPLPEPIPAKGSLGLWDFDLPPTKAAA
jgi:hypothetical protein